MPATIMRWGSRCVVHAVPFHACTTSVSPLPSFSSSTYAAVRVTAMAARSFVVGAATDVHAVPFQRKMAGPSAPERAPATHRLSADEPCATVTESESGSCCADQARPS